MNTVMTIWLIGATICYFAGAAGDEARGVPNPTIRKQIQCVATAMLIWPIVIGYMLGKMWAAAEKK